MEKSCVLDETMIRFPSLLPPILLLITAMMIGCGRPGHDLAPVSGTVTYRGTPLEFGTVTFQPERGAPATGDIQPDGSFRMATLGQGGGAAVGKNRVRVACFESQNNAGGAGDPNGIALGKALIPSKYLSYDTSGIVVEVRAGSNDPVVLDLKE